MSPTVIGLALIILSQVSFAAMDSFIKALGPELSVATILFYRNVIMFLFICPVFLKSGDVYASVARIPFHAIRSVSGQIGMVLIFLSLHLLPLSEASVLRSLTPLFVPILAFIWLKEQLSWMLIPCFILAVIGSWLLAGVDKFELTWLSLLPISAGLFVALAMVAIKRMSKIARGSEIVFYFSLLGIISSVILACFTEFSVPNRAQTWLLIFFMGFAGSIGQITLTRANVYVEANILAPFYYLNAVFGAFISHFYWHESLGLWGWIGAVMIITSGLLLTFKKALYRYYQRYIAKKSHT